MSKREQWNDMPRTDILRQKRNNERRSKRVDEQESHGGEGR